MRLLVITQKVDINDDNLGFFHAWLEEFAGQLESIIVVCLQKGEYNLPSNVRVLSLGKPASRLKYIYRFYSYILRERNNYDAVFVHMNAEYVILGGLFWKMMNKKIYLWYTHKATGFLLRLAERFVSRIFTASKESCRIKSKKIIITGHGIDTDKFSIFKSQFSNKFRIITAGRITPAKNLDILIKTAGILRDKNFNFQIKIAGAPIFETDKVYFQKLKILVKEKKLEDKIIFMGAIPYRKIAEFYKSGNLFVNFSDTGSIDKVVFEAMASGLLVLTSNEAFKNILPQKYFTGKKPEEVAEKIITLSRDDPGSVLRDYVVNNHSLNQLITKIISLMT